MPVKCKFWLSLALFLWMIKTSAAVFPPQTHYEICFTPQQDCTNLLRHAIDQAGKNIYVQAYSFTSRRLADALVKAQRRGVKVRVILDKTNFQPGQRSVAKFLFEHGILIWQDFNLNIAHNKIMIIDNKTVEMGSFNYTTSAQKFNAENMLIIHDAGLAAQYLRNWQARLRVAVRMKYRNHRWVVAD